MNCEQARKELELVINGGLSGEEARSVRRHFASCSECCAVLAPSQWVEILPAMDEMIEPSGDFTARFHSKLSARPVPWWRRMTDWPYARRLATAGTLAAVMLIGVFVIRYPKAGLDRAAYMNDLQVAENLPLLQDMAVVSNLDLLEDFDTIENLPNLMQNGETN